MINWALGGAKRRDWASGKQGIGQTGHRALGIGRSEAEGLGGAKRRDWASGIGAKN
ncbi:MULTISPECIES: hypothetical protein [Microcoleaceae]|uniref:hypothetical protein n=1 Tax=Microcoleaceae TaxID=1892252 RepID=UPI001880DB52|nr:hypothetical protein [Tychonema sp. LEGE 06208]MBE9165259.1 hypothetical protein [Tychonema sp. LEGE 06208]